jgi:hypothetical protein
MLTACGALERTVHLVYDRSLDHPGPVLTLA